MLLGEKVRGSKECTSNVTLSRVLYQNGFAKLVETCLANVWGETL